MVAQTLNHPNLAFQTAAFSLSGNKTCIQDDETGLLGQAKGNLRRFREVVPLNDWRKLQEPVGSTE